MKIRAPKQVTITQREDARVEVAVDGYVQWCGRDPAAAHAIATSLGRQHSGQTDRKQQNHNLNVFVGRTETE